MLERAPVRLGDRVAVGDIDPSEDARDDAVFDQRVDLVVDVLDAAVGDEHRGDSDVGRGLAQNGHGRRRAQPFANPPGEDPPT
jgi:hypothetical protein